MKITKPLLPFAFALALLAASPAHAVLKEAASMREVFPEVTEGTLLVLDLDNTVIEASQELGSDQWYDHVLQSIIDSGVDRAEALPRAMSIWKRVNEVSTVRPVESGTPAAIGGAQDAQIAVMGLTARPSDFGDRTREQLASVGVDLSRTAPATGTFDFGAGLKFDRGIVFVTGQDKGVALLSFLRGAGYRPARVVFVDDKLHNVQDVERALDQTDIEHVSFRYGAADEEVRAYDPRVAEMQERYFGRILDNGACARLLLGGAQ